MHLTPSATLLKVVGLLCVWGGVFGIFYASSVNPRGIIRRYASDYVAKLDADFHAMLRAKRGTELAWLQLMVIVAFLACHALTDHPYFLFGATLAVWMPAYVIRSMVKRRRARIDEQAHGFSLALANTLRTTASVGDALRFTVDVSEKPIREEIELALREIRVGSTAEEALLAAAGRAGAPALDIVVSTILIGQKTGGDLPKILEVTANSLRELKRLEEYTDKVTTDPKRGVVLSVVVALGTLVMITKLVPGFLERLLQDQKGQITVLYCAAAFVGSMIFAWRAMRKSI